MREANHRGYKNKGGAGCDVLPRAISFAPTRAITPQNDGDQEDCGYCLRDRLCGLAREGCERDEAHADSNSPERVPPHTGWVGTARPEMRPIAEDLRSARCEVPDLRLNLRHRAAEVDHDLV
ncbi:MAG: hypothetical protein DHS20C19_00990 [Acidimicrobiales bacterium]|nr:MAG: hypothetical protein DHS20C19_00990 [Acidimicrobiales bacterium]